MGGNKWLHPALIGCLLYPEETRKLLFQAYLTMHTIPDGFVVSFSLCYLDINEWIIITDGNVHSKTT